MTKSTNKKQPLDALLEAAVDAIVIADGEARIMRVNPAALEMFGYSEESVALTMACLRREIPDQAGPNESAKPLDPT